MLILIGFLLELAVDLIHPLERLVALLTWNTAEVIINICSGSPDRPGLRRPGILATVPQLVLVVLVIVTEGQDRLPGRAANVLV